MILFRIGDSIVNENAFICMKLRLDDYRGDATYKVDAYWNDGEDVNSTTVHTFAVPRSNNKLTKKKIDAEFRTAYKNIEWQTYATAEG